MSSSDTKEHGDEWHDFLQRLDSPRVVEVCQLKRRFRTSFTELGSDPESFSFQFEPTDPDSPFDFGIGLKLIVTLPPAYPQEPCKILVDSDSIEFSIRVTLEKVIAAQAVKYVGKPMIRKVLHWLDSQLTSVLLAILDLRRQAARRKLSPAVSGAASGGAAEDTPAGPVVPTSTASLDVEPAVEDTVVQSAAPAPAVESSEPVTWTLEQQLSLDAALRTIPPSDNVLKRWTAIAARVPEKSIVECIARYLQLRAVADNVAKSRLPEPAVPAGSSGGVAVTSPAAGGGVSVFNQLMGVGVGAAGVGAAGRGRGAGLSAGAQPFFPGRPVGFTGKPFRDPKLQQVVVEDAESEDESEEEEEEAGPDDAAAVEDEEPMNDEVEPDAVDEEGEPDAELAEEPEEAAATDVDLFKFSLNPSRHGTQILLDGLYMENVGVAHATVVTVLLACTRCQRKQVVALSASAETAEEGVTTLHKAWCKCGYLHQASLRPDMLHERNTTLAYLDLIHCVAEDLISASLSLTCLGCNADVPLTGFVLGRRFQSVCRSCHEHCRVVARGLRIINLGESSQGVHKKAGNKNQGPRIVPGQPLPQNGTCQHYAQSYRWLRFPCCGVAYACDQCHDFSSDHPAEWAHLMICGHCSRQQAFSNKPCKFCGQSMTNISHTRHWEGGKGCRDVSRMSKRDPKKYSNLNKTRSRKAERVGAAGKASRDDHK